jgi:hypothetical protein
MRGYERAAPVQYCVVQRSRKRAEQQCASAKLIVDVDIRYILMYAAE